jgi:hypothetical protein
MRQNRQIHQLFIQFINYVWYLLHVSALHCHPQGAFLVPSERCSIEKQSIEYCGWACCVQWRGTWRSQICVSDVQYHNCQWCTVPQLRRWGPSRNSSNARCQTDARQQPFETERDATFRQCSASIDRVSPLNGKQHVGTSGDSHRSCGRETDRQTACNTLQQQRTVAATSSAQVLSRNFRIPSDVFHHYKKSTR